MTRILIVDDNEQNLYMLKILLEGNGFEIIQARDGAKALELACNNPPDVIISDILMPVMDGFTLCREWQKDQVLNKIPFIFYTATYTDPRDKEFALGLGAKRFIIKPTEPDIFIKLLQEVLENHNAGWLPSSDEPVEKETLYLKEYNEVLVRKLEAKMLQLEKANKALESDIAAREKAEEATRIAYSELDQIFNSSAHGMFVVDTDFSIIRVNNKFFNLSGKEDNVVGSKCYDIFPDQTCHTENCPLVKIINGEERVEHEIEKIRTDEEKCPCNVIATPLMEQEGNLNGVVIDIKDITKQVKEREERENRISQLAALSRLSQVVTSSLDLDTVLQEIILLAGEVVGSDYTSVILVDEKGQIDIGAENLPIDVPIQYRTRPGGMTQHIIRIRKPVIVNDIDDNFIMIPYPGNDAPHIANPQVSRAGIRSFAGLPLIVKEQLLGVLFMHSQQKDTFHDQMPILTIAANQAAIAIENARLYQQAQTEIDERRTAEHRLKKQLARIQMLNDIVRAITQRQDLLSVFRVVLNKLVDQFGIDYACSFLYDSSSETFTIANQTSRKDLPLLVCLTEGRKIPVKKSVFESWDDSSHYLPDMNKSENQNAREMALEGIRSVFIVVLNVQNRPIGALAFSSKQGDAFDIEEREFLIALGKHISLAGGQAQLFHDLQAAYNEIRQTQQAVMQQERLRALGQMASGIAHDINNALAISILYLDLLQRNNSLDANVREKLGIIHTSAKDISKIVERMRAFYRQRDERVPLMPVDLNKIVQQVIDLTKPRWKDMPQARGVMVETSLELQNDLPAIMGLEHEIREALTNLIFNAVDAMPAGGTITARTGAYEVISKGKKQTIWICCEVQDDGIGMNQETLRRCFEPFYTTKGEMGTGLGLATVYGVMQRHEGRAEVESEPGNGATIRLLFPVP
ncbi:MAG: GAF domain-containing protein, partial [Anaerolineales bacterium]|nr:GAF domain-containing protein [Anaerolineales bacterium]